MHRCILLAALLVSGTLGASRDAGAHPLGNFSISQYSAIRIQDNEIELLYIIDMAEIPTFQEIQVSGIVPNIGEPAVAEYAVRKAQALGDALSLELNGQRLTLRPDSHEILFPPGAGGLPTLKIGIRYKAALAQYLARKQFVLHYRDNNFAGRAGWKEIIATAAPGMKIIDSSVPAVDRSSELSDYPTDLLNTPPQQLQARVVVSASNTSGPLATITASGPAATNNPSEVRFGSTTPRLESNSPLARVNSQLSPRNSFTELMASQQMGFGIVLIALAVAAGLGAFHALEPGHGKTLVAAYLVGSRGTLQHALLLGLIVTIAHTAGVYLLGAATLYASNYIIPERLYPWLALTSGLMIMALGLILFWRRYRARESEPLHHHGHSHQHHAHYHGHEHGEPHSHRVSRRELLTLGISGGIIPCPAALVVLLSAVSLQRTGFGLLLIIAFSIGLAAVLIAIGMLTVYARNFTARFNSEGRIVTRWLPLTSSLFIVFVGLALTGQALASAGFFQL